MKLLFQCTITLIPGLEEEDVGLYKGDLNPKPLFSPWKPLYPANVKIHNLDILVQQFYIYTSF